MILPPFANSSARSSPYYLENRNPLLLLDSRTAWNQKFISEQIPVSQAELNWITYAHGTVPMETERKFVWEMVTPDKLFSSSERILLLSLWSFPTLSHPYFFGIDMSQNWERSSMSLNFIVGTMMCCSEEKRTENYVCFMPQSGHF